MKQKTKIFKIILLVVVIAIMVAVTIYLIPTFKELSSEAGQQAFKQKVNDSGFVGFLMLFGLQFAQIFLFIIPGEPIEILAGLCYGSLWGTVFIMLSAAIISAFIYLLVHKLGREFIYEFVKPEKIEKIEKSKLFQNPQTIRYIIFILFFIPGTPKDLLVYLGGLLPIKPWRFILISTFARFPSIISSTIVGSKIMDGNVKIIVMVYVATFILTGLIILLVNKFDKNKVTKEAIKVIK